MNQERTKTQEAQILDYLRSHLWITPQDAIKRFNCLRLAARIYDLRQRGFLIDCDKSNGFAAYRLVKEPEQEAV